MPYGSPILDRLDQLRQSGVSNAKLGEWAGKITPQAVSQWFASGKPPSIRRLERLASEGNISLAWLLYGDGEPPGPTVPPSARAPGTARDRLGAAVELGWHDMRDAAEVLQFRDESELRERLLRDPPDPVLLARLLPHGVMPSWVRHGDPDGIPGGLAILIGLHRPWVSNRIAAMVADDDTTAAQSAVADGA